jgi:HAD superfamily hydrolase (TIGR01509 family)
MRTYEIKGKYNNIYMNIIIPLGGKGERFFKAGYAMPKPLIPVLDKVMIFYILDNLSLSIEDNIYIFYHISLDEHGFMNIVMEKYPTVQFIPITYQTSGAVETILLGLEKVESEHKKCVLLDCDTFYTEDILDMVRKCSTNMVFYVHREGEKPIYSYIELDSENNIIRIKEKNKISSCANTGCYVFSDINELKHYCKYVIDNKITFKGEPYTSCVIQEMIRMKHVFVAYELKSTQVFSLGTPEEVDQFLENTYCFLFDLDGTLVNTDKVYYKVWKQILNKYNIDLTEDIFQKYIHGNSDETVIKTLIPIVTDNISEWKDRLFIENLSDVVMIDGALDLMKKVAELGHKCAIVTNCNRKVAERVVGHFHFDRFIDFIIVGAECSKPKPYPEPYLAAMKRYNILSNRAIIFEDSKSGLLSASSANPYCIVGITTNYSKKELLVNGAATGIDDYLHLDIPSLLSCNNTNINMNIENHIRNSLHKVIKVHSIEVDDVKLKGGYISDVLGLRIRTQTDEIMECVLKLENTHETPLSTMATALGLYDRENYFYENISKYVPLAIPKFYGLVKDSDFRTIGILMENLYKRGCFDINLDLNTVDIDIALKVIDSISKLHISFWNKRLENFSQLKKHNDLLFNPSWKEFIDGHWPDFKDKWKHVIPSFDKGDSIAGRFGDIQESLSNGHLTLIHGDVKSPNIFYDRSNGFEPYFIDWQYICIGKGVQDIVFFLIESFTLENIKLYYPLFIQYYYAKLIQGGVIGYSYEEYKKDVKDAICYFPFFVAVWFGTTPEDSLIDKNFPFFFIQKLFYLLDIINHI